MISTIASAVLIRLFISVESLRAFDGEGGGLGVGGFGGLGAAYRNLVAAGGDGADAFVVDLRERARIEGEGDVFGLAGRKLDAGEAVERQLRGYIGVRRREVELGDLFAGALAGVLDVGLDGEGVAGVESVAWRASHWSRRRWCS